MSQTSAPCPKTLSVGVLLAVVTCESTVTVERADTSTVQVSSSMASSSSVGSGGAAVGGGGGCPCSVRDCDDHVYACGDCIDNDNDGLLDSGDTHCTGPCDHTEDSFHDGIPMSNGPPCHVDCYFDPNTGAGNDDCYWSHACDPYEVPPAYYPEPWNGVDCAYDASVSIIGTDKSCDELYSAQSMECLAYCMPIVPNGCDCFGCCELPAGSDKWVWLGSAEEQSTKCSLDHVTDPTICHPCTPVPSCLNECETCELCIGRTALEPECAEPACPSEHQRCADGCEPRCPDGQYCVTGCCVPLPR